MQCIEINSVKINFDKEMTRNNITPYNAQCDCQYCKNYYKNIECNIELRNFLSQFGIDYLRTEEVISYDLGENKESLVHSMAYYDVFGYIEKEVSVEKGDYTISFMKNADVNVGHEIDDKYFWIVLDIVLPYLLEEERELSYISDEKNFFSKIKERLTKLFKKKYDRQLPERPDWETVVEMMYDKQLDCFDDEIIRVIYSKDKSKRYLILKKESGVLTYQLEVIYQYDDEEWKYICDSKDALPAMWEPYYTEWRFSHFEREEELMNELIHEPEYKQFFL